MTGRWVGLVVLILVGVGSYIWWLHLTHGVRALGRADATIIISDRRPACAVRASARNARREVPCREVSTYLRNDLRLSPGALVGITAVGKVGRDKVATLSSDLAAHGFKIAGVMRVRVSGP